ncbi:YitT family protein [Microbacteriaceae bacterium 4G12]
MKISRIILFITGIAFLTLGISLTIKANVGLGAWDALAVSQSHTFGMTVGTWMIINQSILLFVNAYLLKEKPQFLAAITFVLIGFSVDFWLLQVFSGWNPQDIWQRWGILLMGIVVIGFGAGLYLQAHMPMLNPIDLFMIALKTRLHVNLMTAKTLGELTALVFALILHGPISIGTLVITFTVGPVVQFFYKWVEQMKRKWNIALD